MVAIALSLPRRAEYKLFRHPPVQDLGALSGASIRLMIPPFYGYEIDTGPLSQQEADKLAGEINNAYQNEVMIAIKDEAPTNGSTVTVASVSGQNLTLSGFSGSWYEGKVISILHNARRYLVPTTGLLVSGVVKMAATPRVTFTAGDAVTYNAPQLQGLLFNGGDVLKQINKGNYSNGLKLIIRENV